MKNNEFYTILFDSDKADSAELSNLHASLTTRFPDKYFIFLPEGYSFTKMSLEELKRIRESLDIFISFREDLEKH